MQEEKGISKKPRRRIQMTTSKAYSETLTVGDKLWGQTTLEGNRGELIKKTYLLLGLSVISSLVGGVIGANSPTLVHLFSGWLGWILALVLLNGIPQIALSVRDNPVLGLAALVADGFVSGLVLAPILQLASVVAPDLVPTALILTAVVFVGVAGYVMTVRKTFSAPRGLMIGIFFSTIGVMILNTFLHLGILGMLIAGAIGVFGVLILVHATSEALHSPEADSPIAGALMLFAGLFNVFVAALDILLRLEQSDE